MAVVEILLCVLALVFIFFKWATLKYKTFEKRGVPYEKPVPLVGNQLGTTMGKESLGKGVLDFYSRNKAHKIAGYFNFREPIFMVNDPESIKKITVKDFDHFQNHHPFFDTNNDPILDGMLTIMKDQRWKNMRNTVTPVFTASKMRSMFTLMNECFDESLKHLREKSHVSGSYELEMKDCFTRLSNDIIASTAFGLKVNSFEDRSNEFYTIGQAITSFRGKEMIKFMCAAVAPKLTQLFGFSLIGPEKTNYFMSLVMDTMKYREEHKIVRPDMIQMLLEAKNESTQNWSDEDIVAQCFVFFFAAFDNNANLICTTCHELMDNPEIQERLYEEVVEMRTELNGAPLNYDAVNKMKYMDMVVSESLRKWPLAVLTDRVCSKDYQLTNEDGQLIFQFKKADHIWIPIIGLHSNEEYFEHPHVFDPERFSDENKDNIKPFTYVPFGMGPRICIGNRYALMQAKAMLYYLLLDFKLERSPKSVENLMDDIRGFQIAPKSGFWLNLVSRK